MDADEHLAAELTDRLAELTSSTEREALLLEVIRAARSQARAAALRESVGMLALAVKAALAEPEDQ